uniref:Tubulin-tyrosine ligase n=1 Tax=viral metagenome TaxID=1070528 RepID=A0A6C0HN22_9ZZZZ
MRYTRKQKQHKQHRQYNKTLHNKTLNNKKHTLKFSKQNARIHNVNTYTNTYYIVDCIGAENNKLIFNVLEPYLKDLNLIPDKMMPIIRQLDLSFIKKHKITPSNYCSINVHVPKLDKTITNKLHPQLHPQFMWYHINSIYLNNRFYNIKCNMINIINSSKLKSISDKRALYTNMHLYCPKICSKHMANTFKINDFNKYIGLDTTSNTTSYYILRPIDSYSGIDILYISSKAELADAIEYYKKTKNYKGKKYGTDVIASTYIINPLLFKGYKFHLRMYYLISFINGKFNSFLYDNYGKILTAGRPYDIKKPFTKEVHDTHVKYSSEDNSFPKDFNENTISENYVSPNHIIKQMQDILKGVSIILKKTKGQWLFENQQHGFQFLGIDFMIDTNGCVFLIECNTSPGFNYSNSANSYKFSQNLFKWINETILEPYYKKTNPKLHSTYLDLHP